eukprot:6477031-Amphidinium_carterae.2
MQEGMRQLAERMQSVEQGYTTQVQQLTSQVQSLQQQLMAANSRGVASMQGHPPVIDTKLLPACWASRSNSPERTGRTGV